ncbi:unnamed protein product [Arctogadus glacialis]
MPRHHWYTIAIQPVDNRSSNKGDPTGHRCTASLDDLRSVDLKTSSHVPRVRGGGPAPFQGCFAGCARAVPSRGDATGHGHYSVPSCTSLPRRMWTITSRCEGIGSKLTTAEDTKRLLVRRRLVRLPLRPNRSDRTSRNGDCSRLIQRDY